MIKIGFLGPKGTFSQEAMFTYTKGSNDFVEVDYNTMVELIMAVENDEIDEAIVPIENSLEGAVSTTMDMLAADVDLKIKAEAVIAIKQNLMARKGTNIEDIKYILSHPQPIGQCRKYLNSAFPHAVIKYVYSTAQAAKEVAHGEGNMAAVGSLAAATEYGLQVLKESIQDSDNNLTRFVIISKEEAQRAARNKTSIVFSTENRPGSLYRILDIFSLWDINMTRIESRPAKNELGKYIFFVDINGHVEDEDVRDALTMVKRKTSFYKFLGSYPEFETRR
ncbi:prephenate dehydratase [Acetivibrio mesophilus]|jgi:prephenate dehydratase|uniref:Prephenate dehydratase n=1 Tax=Acetivibrio mesophilus TaxID=2487273 RepID=A0A4Q0I3N8_9FIRM|nr:prephenate dehydratase [Acetivibrio mesophilus]ODM27306.1 prephenate dehydratase [Clostridium sp. Bc-iso-3]RXE58856.1 prephenate dehydratase [Acetivibrio mesophilus]HHV29548.1 prephenate dehydratase [Clostridium sp.]